MKQIISAVTKIVGSISAGGALTLASAGGLTIGGISIAVEGVIAGTIQVSYGGTVITAAASNFNNDVKRFAELSNKGGKGTKKVGKPYIQNGTYNEIRNKLGKDAADKFIDAMNKGLVSGSGESGIKLLGGQGAKVGNTFYKYEIKIKGSFGDYRVYGNYSDKLGTIIFDKFSRGVGH